MKTIWSMVVVLLTLLVATIIICWLAGVYVAVIIGAFEAGWHAAVELAKMLR